MTYKFDREGIENIIVNLLILVFVLAVGFGLFKLGEHLKAESFSHQAVPSSSVMQYN